MEIQENVSLAQYTTLRIGGVARYFARAETQRDIEVARKFARKLSLPLFVLGGGSNLVVADEGFPGVVLKIDLHGDIIERGGQKDSHDEKTYEVAAGTDWDRFVQAVCKDGIFGVECLAGIPGTVGASPVQNIGAYGQEVSQTIKQVDFTDRESGHTLSALRANCGFAYRTSMFNSARKDRYVITSVVFAFASNAGPNLKYPDLKRHFAGKPNPTPLDVYQAVREIRAAKGMLIDPAHPTPDSTSAGSFFKNPVVPLAALDRIALHLGIRVEQIQHWPVTAHPEVADPGGTVPQQGSGGRTKLPAAWLIERAGFPKGYTLGPVGISTKHTLALTNRTGTATCADLFALRDRIVAGVEDAFGIRLEQEPVYLS